MAYTFDQIEARDPAIPELVASNAFVTIFTPDDPTKTPLALTKPSGEPLENPIQVNAMGYGPAFISELDRVAWEGGNNGEFSGFFTSYEGMKQVALDAQTAAESAAATAANEASSALAGAVADADQAKVSATAAAASAASAAALVGAPADSAMAATANNNSSQFRTALNATFVPRSEMPPATLDGGNATSTFSGTFNFDGGSAA